MFKFEITADTTAVDWATRHTDRLARMHEALKEIDDPEVIKSFGLEIKARNAHLLVIKRELESSLAGLVEMGIK